MKKKLIAAMLIAVMSASALAGCGAGGNDNNESSKEVVLEEVDESGKAGIMYAEGLPLVDPGDYTFSVFVDNGTPEENMFMLPILEEQTGIKIDFQMFPFEIAKEKFGLALSSGDYADCIGGWCLSQNDILTYGVDMGIFLPLEKYFEAYCPRIMEILELPGVRETMTAPDGHIYSIPYVLEAPILDFKPFINKRWLDNVGMDVPTTTEEFRAVLKAFKEQDANGNGNVNDEIPMSFDPDNKHLGYFSGWFGCSVDNNGFTMVGDKLEFGANTEEWKNGIRYLSTLYADGLLDTETFTQDIATWKAKGAQDLYGVVMAYGSGDVFPYELGAEPDFVPLPVLKSPECENPVWLRDTYGTSILKNQVVITDAAEHPEVICRWWDNLYSLDNSVQALNGPLGKVLFKDEEGNFEKIDMTTLSEEEQSLYSWANMFPQSLPKYIPSGFEMKVAVENYDEDEPFEELYAPYLTEAIPSYWLSAEDAAVISEYETSIRDYIDQKTAQWVSGQGDIDAEWDEYIKQLDKLKLQDYISMRKAAIGQAE